MALDFSKRKNKINDEFSYIADLKSQFKGFMKDSRKAIRDLREITQEKKED